MNQQILVKIIRNKVVQHTLFWVLSFGVLLQFFAYSDELHKSDWIYAGLFHLPLILAVYTNLRLLIPQLLNGSRYLLFILSLLVLILFTTWFLQFTFEVLTDYIFPGYYFISYYEMADYIKFGLIYLLLTTLLKLSKSWFELNETKQLLEKLNSEKLQAELSALKGQINPHFLFNSLNSIYSLSIENEPITSKFILKLSEVLRYMIYEANEEKVSLKNELKYLENFVELQRLRVDDADVKIEFLGNSKKSKIAPLLLIPLVENGFKHGIKGDTENAFIHIFAKTEKNDFYFSVKNNKGQIDETESDRFKGIGLKNVQRRLELIYPNKHEIRILESDTTFKVVLNINLA